MLAGALYLGRNELFYAEQERRIAKLTVEEVNSAMRTHLDPARLVIVRAGDSRRRRRSRRRSDPWSRLRLGMVVPCVEPRGAAANSPGR